MTSKTSLINGGIIKHNFKRFWWVSALYTLIMTLSTPFVIFMQDYDRLYSSIYGENSYHAIGDILRQDFPSMFYLAIVPVLIAVCVFRYMQNSRSVTMFHSMPINRKKLFVSEYISGFLLFAIPILIVGMFLLMMCVFKYSAIFTILDVFKWVSYLLLFGTVAYTMTVFTGIFTGSSIAQFVFVYILNALPFILVACAAGLFSGWLKGFDEYSCMMCLKKMLNYSPLSLFNRSYDVIHPWQLWLMGGYIILFFVLALTAYQKRDMEHSGDISAFGWINPIFLYGVTICSMILGTLFIKAVANFNSRPSIIAVVLWSVFGYAVAKMLLTKSFNIFKYYKGIIVYCVIALIAFAGINFDVLGYADKIPAMQSIKSVYVGSYLPANYLLDNSILTGDDGNGAKFTSEENIKAAVELHKYAIENHSPENMSNDNYSDKDYDSGSYYDDTVIAYKLKNGKTLVRKYYIVENSKYKLYNTEEGKESRYPYITKMPEKITSITADNPSFDPVRKADLGGMIDALKRDIYAVSFEDTINKTGKTLTLKITVNENNRERDFYFTLSDKYENTIRFLNENGYEYPLYNPETDSYDKPVSITSRDGYVITTQADENGEVSIQVNN